PCHGKGIEFPGAAQHRETGKMVLFRNRIAPQAASLASRVTRAVACLLLLAAAWSLPARAQAQQWRTASDRDGIRLETRRIPGERFDELRVSTSLDASPGAIADYLFGKYLEERNRNIRRTFIER